MMGTFLCFMMYCFGYSYMFYSIIGIPILLTLALKEGKRKYLKKATLVLILNILIGIILVQVGPFNKNECDESFYSIINVLEGLAVGMYVFFGSTLLNIPSSKIK